MTTIFTSAKDNCTEIQTPGVYEILYSCGKSYRGETGRAIEVRIKEYKQDVVHNRIDKLTAAEHGISWKKNDKKNK